MSITDELRKYARGHELMVNHKLLEIADSIDAEHESAMAEQFKSLTVDMEPMTDENMAKGGWVRLPVDADGVPIRVGDVMEGELVNGGFGEPFEVAGYIMTNGELEPMDKNKAPRKRKYSHHHKPTVENLLDKFALEIDDARHIPDADEEYARIRAEYVERIKEVLRDA